MEDGGGCGREEDGAGGRTGRAGRADADSPAPAAPAPRGGWARAGRARCAAPCPAAALVPRGPEGRRPRGCGRPGVRTAAGQRAPPRLALSPPGSGRMEQPRARPNLSPCLSPSCDSGRLPRPPRRHLDSTRNGAPECPHHIPFSRTRSAHKRPAHSSSETVYWAFFSRARRKEPLA